MGSNGFLQNIPVPTHALHARHAVGAPAPPLSAEELNDIPVSEGGRGIELLSKEEWCCDRATD